MIRNLRSHKLILSPRRRNLKWIIIINILIQQDLHTSNEILDRTTHGASSCSQMKICRKSYCPSRRISTSWHSALRWFKSINSTKTSRKPKASSNISSKRNGDTSGSYQAGITPRRPTTWSLIVMWIPCFSKKQVTSVDTQSSLWAASSYNWNSSCFQIQLYNHCILFSYIIA